MNTIPAIGNKLAEIKLAMEKGDATELELAKESYRTDLAKLENDMLKKHYSTVSGELTKAYEAQRVAQAKIDKFTYHSDIKVAETTGRWNRKTAKTKARVEGIQERKLDEQDHRQETELFNTKTNKIFQLAEKYNLPPESMDALVRGLGDVDPQHEKEAIFEKLLRLEQDDKIPEATRQQFIRDAHKIIGIGGSSTTGGAGEPPKLTQTQGDDVAFNALTPLLNIPVLITDKNKRFLGKAWFGGKHDEVEGRIPTETDFQSAAREMVAAARKTGRQGLHPNLWLKSIDTEIREAREVLEEYSDVLVDGGIEFDKTPEEEYPDDPGDQDIMRQNMRDLIEAKQTIDFFDSEAGQQYLDWVGESLSESLRQDKIVYVNPPAFGSSAERSQADIDYRKKRDPSMRRGKGVSTAEAPPATTPITTRPDDTSVGRFRKIEAGKTPAQNQQLPPSKRRMRGEQNIQMQLDAMERDLRLKERGWKMGDYIKYVGPKRKIGYLSIYPNQIFRILGTGQEMQNNVEYIGIKVQGIRMPSTIFKDTTPEERQAGSPWDTSKGIIPVKVWDDFMLRQ